MLSTIVYKFYIPETDSWWRFHDIKHIITRDINKKQSSKKQQFFNLFSNLNDKNQVFLCLWEMRKRRFLILSEETDKKKNIQESNNTANNQH